MRLTFYCMYTIQKWELVMNSTSMIRLSLASAFVVTALCGCTTPGAGPHRMHHAAAAQATGPHGQQAGQGRGMGHAEMGAMCSGVHDKLRSARSAEERAAIMHEHMRAMSPDMRQKMHDHMRSMSNEERAQLCMKPR